jgi:uncharacterized membrane protein YecN with MAPEG domain
MQELAAPVAVIVSYFAVYYALMVNQLRLRVLLVREAAARGEKFDRYRTDDPRMRAADRYVGNMLEHMPPFLVLFAANVMFTGAIMASIAGGIYVLCRIAYPLAMGARLGRSVPLRILAATAPSYLVLLYFAVMLVWFVW